LKKKSKTNKAPYIKEDDSDFLNHATSSKNPIDKIYEHPKSSDIYLANYKLTDDLTFISCIIRHMNIEGINFWFAFFYW